MIKRVIALLCILIAPAVTAILLLHFSQHKQPPPSHAGLIHAFNYQFEGFTAADIELGMPTFKHAPASERRPLVHQRLVAAGRMCADAARLPHVNVLGQVSATWVREHCTGAAVKQDDPLREGA